MKAHLRLTMTGTQVLCGANIFRTSGYAVLRGRFLTLPDRLRCKRCEKKLGLTPGACPKAEADPEFTH